MSNPNITKIGQLIDNEFIENGFSIQDIKFTNGTSTIAGPTNGIYTVTSPVATGTWGAPFSITRGSVIVPYNAFYRIEMEVNVSTAHSIQIDINNISNTVAAWNGNDNDLLSSRTSTAFSIPANTWTKITWGSKNLHASNTTKDELLVYDGIGLKTENDTATVTWQFRNPMAKIYFNDRTVASIGKFQANSNCFYEY